MTKKQTIYIYIDSNGQWFDKAKADEFDPETGEILYFTQKDNFILYIPPADPKPEKYNEVTHTFGVTWMQANGFENDITNKMIKPIKDYEM